MGSLPVRNLGGDRSVVVGGNIKCPGRKKGGLGLCALREIR